MPQFTLTSGAETWKVEIPTLEGPLSLPRPLLGHTEAAFEIQPSALPHHDLLLVSVFSSDWLSVTHTLVPPPVSVTCLHSPPCSKWLSRPNLSVLQKLNTGHTHPAV